MKAIRNYFVNTLFFVIVGAAYVRDCFAERAADRGRDESIIESPKHAYRQMDGACNCDICCEQRRQRKYEIIEPTYGPNL